MSETGKSSLKTRLIKDEEAAGSGYDRTTTFDRKNTFAEHGRKNTFSRAFTFDGEALRAAVQQPLSGLQRTITEVGQRFDPDAQFTKAVIKEYVKHAESGNDGDLPLPPGFARKSGFWKMIFLCGLVASFMGVASAAFMNFGDEVPKQWQSCDFGNDASCGDWYTGHTYWIVITTATGFVVGLIRYTFDYPENLPGIFKEILDYHVDPKWSALTYLISAISLGGGATLGPEQALGNLGGGIATFVSEHIMFEDDDDRKIFVLTGMSSALGALFPSPMLGALMIHELGNPPKTFMESTSIMSVGAIIGFAVYYEMVGVTYLEHITNDGIMLAITWLQDPGYQNWQVVTGFVIGIVSAALCILVLLTIGVTKQVFSRIRQKLEHNALLKNIVPPVLGGLTIGCINWALPATVGNGNMIFGWIIKYGSKGQVSQKLLMCTGFARMFLLGISMNCGFIGGIIFPFLTMGLLSGTIMYLNYSYVPLGLCIGCFIISLPCGIVPMPFTFTCLSVFIFYYGLYETVPIFVASITSYLIVCGSGLFKKLSSQANKQKQAEGTGDNNSEEEQERARHLAKQEADDFALKQYLGNKTKQAAPTHH